ncbi:hypothetical protein V6M85_09065 [Sulfolobus tengchongensis]|uniref:Uncharacterized protein n=1 Tax=Sulfolobus tengchongensis TaxID=207809 RepID=A0AAX4KZN7_9CREN
MGIINLLIKHRYGQYGLLSYVELEFALGVGIVASYNFFHPQTRSVIDGDQLEIFNIIIWTIGIILATLVIKNISLGIGQDLYDGTIISFLQMRSRREVFFLSYFVDVLLIGIIFILASELVFSLASFNPPLIWINSFLSQYLFICNTSYIFTILIKRPFRSFFTGIVIILILLGIELTGYIGVFNYLLPIDIVLIYLAYYLFKKVSI